MLDRIAANVPGSASHLPKRFYLERGSSALRPLLNEHEVSDALRPLGFVPIRPETLTIADQIRLFRQAEAVVAPHGAGLTNLGFCCAGCRILELQMDAYTGWHFRHLAALRGLRYDCVIGRAQGAWSTENVHGLPWQISVAHVTAAAIHMTQQ